MRSALPLLLVLGCAPNRSAPVGNGTPRPPPATTPPRAPGLPALYADLFVDGATWSFPATAERRDRDDIGAVVVSDVVRGTITCRVSAVLVIRGGKRCQLDCTADRADFPLTNVPGGTFVGTADGLWEAPFDFINDIATLDPRRVVLVPEPREGRRDIVDGGADWGGADYHQAIETHAVAGGWCYVYHYDGEWEGSILCLRAGDGVIGGAGFYLGAGSELFHFGETWRM